MRAMLSCAGAALSCGSDCATVRAGSLPLGALHEVLAPPGPGLRNFAGGGEKFPSGSSRSGANESSQARRQQSKHTPECVTTSGNFRTKMPAASI